MATNNIAITVDNNYIQHACVMLQSLQAVVTQPVNIFCVYDVLTKANRDVIAKHFNKSNLNITFIPFDSHMLPPLPIKAHDHVSAAAFLRIWLPLMLPRLQQVVFLDTDMVINDDISPLFDLNMPNYALAAVPDIETTAGKKASLNMDTDKQYFNSGVMVLNLRYFREHDITAKLSQFITSYAHLCEFWDQDAFNAVINGHFYALDYTYNVQTSFYAESLKYNQQLQQALNQPAIIHFTGGGSCKPWYYQNQHPHKHLYYKYLKKTPFRHYFPPDIPRNWHLLRKLKYRIANW